MAIVYANTNLAACAGVVTAMILHYGFAAFGLLPSADQVRTVTDREFFAVDYTFWLNLCFGALSLGFLAWKTARSGWSFAIEAGVIEKALFALAMVSYAWLAIGLFVGG